MEVAAGDCPRRAAHSAAESATTATKPFIVATVGSPPLSLGLAPRMAHSLSTGRGKEAQCKREEGKAAGHQPFRQDGISTQDYWAPPRHPPRVTQRGAQGGRAGKKETRRLSELLLSLRRCLTIIMTRDVMTM